jgi:uncharacterized protein
VRLNPDQQTAISQAATQAFGTGVQVWLFGSRADDNKRGGDIDLLVRPDASALDHLFDRKIRMLTKLERLLGERKVDVVIEAPNDSRPIVAIAHATGVQLV